MADKKPTGSQRQYERDDYEHRYVAAVRHRASYGLDYHDDTLDVQVGGVHRDGARTWVTITFRSPDRPGATFARALLAWREHWSDELLDPSWDASLTFINIWEILDAPLWGLPPHPVPGVVTWLHPQRVPPWQFVLDADEPERVAWERRWRERISQLLSAPLPAHLEVGEPTLFDGCGSTHSLVPYRRAEEPDLTFAMLGRVWAGYPLPRGPEERAQNTVDHLRQVSRQREPSRRGNVEVGGITWSDLGAPSWFREGRRR